MACRMLTQSDAAPSVHRPRNDSACSSYLKAAFQVEVKNANSASPAMTPAPNTSMPSALANRSHKVRQATPTSTAQPASGNGNQ